MSRTRKRQGYRCFSSPRQISGILRRVRHCNPNFVRDIGCAFLATGVALIWAFRSPADRFPLVSIAAVVLAAHALLHAYDTLRGALGHNHWLLDLPGVYLPGLFLPWIAYTLAGRERGMSTPSD